MADGADAAVRLVAVDDGILARLVVAATTEARAGEVTAPVSPGEEWTAARVEWLENFHRDRRPGLSGAMGEATWAVVVDGHVDGSVRLKRSGDSTTFEMGIWLRTSSRGRGIGTSAIGLLLERAAAAGAVVVIARTRRENAAALAVLDRLGFSTSPTSDGLDVQARRHLSLPG